LPEGAWCREATSAASETSASPSRDRASSTASAAAFAGSGSVESAAPIVISTTYTGGFVGEPNTSAVALRGEGFGWRSAAVEDGSGSTGHVQDRVRVLRLDLYEPDGLAGGDGQQLHLAMSGLLLDPVHHRKGSASPVPTTRRRQCQGMVSSRDRGV